MTEIISARFQSGGKAYYFAPNGLTLSPGEEIIVETAKGQEFAQCVQGNTQVEQAQVVQPLRPVIRRATQRDREILEENKRKQRKAFEICQAKIAAHKLDMKLVNVEYSFDGSKILFFFTSENRVDFRALVRDLAAQFHARIELRQIGVRDESKMLGGLGICGRPFCCSQFLEEFQPVSIKMAKTQNLSLNPAKISGTCGRLMCCLKYEQGAYEDAVKRCPKNDSFVETPEGVGNITNVNLLRETVSVRLEEEPETPRSFHTSEIRVVRSGKGKRPEDYVPPSKAELAKLRKVTPISEPDSLSRRLDLLLGVTPPLEAEESAGRRDRRRSGERTAEREERREQGSKKSAGSKSKKGRKNPAQPPKAKEFAKGAVPPEEEGMLPERAGEEKKPRRRPHRRRRWGGKGQGSGQKPTE